MDWFVADDGDPSYRPECSRLRFYAHFPPLEDVNPYAGGIQSTRSQLRNLRELLLEANGYDRYLFLEDDTWYAPDFPEVVCSLPDRFRVVGSGPDPLYRVPERRYIVRTEKDQEFCGLCAMAVTDAFKTGFVQPYLEAHKEGVLDRSIWNKTIVPTARVWHRAVPRMVSFKAGPGRRGVTRHHNPVLPSVRSSPLENWKEDPDLSWLAETTGMPASYWEEKLWKA